MRRGRICRRMQTFELQIEGMSCGHCVRAVTEAIFKVEGVTDAAVEVGRATITVEDGVDRAVVIKAIEDEDYRVRT